MIDTIIIKNFKSIEDAEIDLGRMTVLIGANGSGKSNILEAIALSSAAINDKLDNEFLASRGIRVAEPEFMKSAFEAKSSKSPINITIKGGKGLEFTFKLNKSTSQPYASWVDSGTKALGRVEDVLKTINKLVEKQGFDPDEEVSREFVAQLGKIQSRPLALEDFLIYSPEIAALRTFEMEGQIEPLGRKGEGLFKLIRVLEGRSGHSVLDNIKSELHMFDWFTDFHVADTGSESDRRIEIRDRYLDKKYSYFDQRSPNEGFLYVLFYLCLFASRLTPNFFAVDNIDVSLNPKLCRKLIRTLFGFAKKHSKQAILTTHNPAVLDGLNLDDKQQRLYVVRRNKNGSTVVKRILKPTPVKGQELVPLSEMFMRGYLGGLPTNF